MYTCPHCEEHINHVEYRTDGYEYGTYYIENEEWEHVDSCHEGETTFECPECGREIDNVSSLERVDSENDNNNDNNNSNDYTGTMVRRDGSASISVWVCKECKTENIGSQNPNVCSGCDMPRTKNVEVKSLT